MAITLTDIITAEKRPRAEQIISQARVSLELAESSDLRSLMASEKLHKAVNCDGQKGEEVFPGNLELSQNIVKAFENKDVGRNGVVI